MLTNFSMLATDACHKIIANKTDGLQVGDELAVGTFTHMFVG